MSPGDESTGTDSEGPVVTSSSTSPSTSASGPSTSGDPSTTSVDTESTSHGDTTGDIDTETTGTPETTGSTSETTTGETTTGETTTTGDTETTTDETTTGPEDCGNGSVDAGESCDGNDLAGETCTSQGADAGELACADDCTFDLSGCVFFDCGNDEIEGGEFCDGIDLGGQDCLGLGYLAGGDLGCADNCTFDTSGCIGPPCGNDLAEAPEDCDGDDLNGNDCESLGNDGGTLTCAADCTFDESACFIEEALQNDNGNCGFVEVGCSDNTGTAGNPQDLLECYVSSLVAPVDVVEVEYFLGDDVPLPDALDLVVHAWDGPGNAPGALLGSVALDPMIDIVTGGHVLAIPMGIEAADSTFCVGFHGEDMFDGFRVEFTDADATGESYLTADQCGLPTPLELTEAFTPGNFCIRPTVQGH